MVNFLEKTKSSLNPEQLEAVAHTEGPLLILAGAGSGKTRVLTSRIAHLVQDKGISLHRILAMTFSNKAAREMHDRVKLQLGDQGSAKYPWISTFHSVCVRLLRRHGAEIGVSSNFTIYDSNDQLDLIKRAFKKMNLSDKVFNPRAVHSKISSWKNDALKPENVANGVSSHFDEVARDVYQVYQNQLKEAHALDFDDLLVCCLDLFRGSEPVKQHYHRQWQYIMVDEFQDTNKIQYALLKEFLNEDQNICVVGDDDQSIYAWRGAKIENILNFDREFKGCKVVKLEQNYRSTGNILRAASSIIRRNEYRHDKKLWTDQAAGEKITACVFDDDKKEANFVVRRMKSLIQSGTSPKEIAALYRVNAVSRNFEEECLRQGLSYKIVGGFRFYERKEIKDILSYARFLMNPDDRVAFRRSVGEPSRGVGQKSIQKIEAASTEIGQSLRDFILDSEALPVTGKARTGLERYRSVLRWGREALLKAGSLADLFVGIMEDSEYLESLRKDRSEEARERESNLQELLSAVQEFEELWTIESSSSDADADMSLTERKLFDFLERVALISDVDQLDEVEEGQVTFMSLHAAKGLEFDICFITALEDGLFPSIRSIDSPDQIEEERRLFYVGVTRARRKLFFTRAESRRTYGQINFQMPSRFIEEVDPEVMEVEGEQFAPSVFKKKRERAYEDYSQDSYDFEFDQELDCFSFNRGDRVKHPSFGDGIVRKIEVLGSDECLTIDFAVRGRKRVLSQYVSKSP